MSLLEKKRGKKVKEKNDCGYKKYDAADYSCKVRSAPVSFAFMSFKSKNSCQDDTQIDYNKIHKCKGWLYEWY